MDNHITAMGSQPLKFKTDVAMMGKLGYDVKVNELSPKDLAFSQNAVAIYNSIKDIIWHGQQYRLQDPYENSVASLAYVNEQQTTAIVFNYYVSTLISPAITIPIKLKGLDASKKYKIEEINQYPGSRPYIDKDKIYTGDFLMKIGFNPQADARRTSVVLKVTAI